MHQFGYNLLLIFALLPLLFDRFLAKRVQDSINVYLGANYFCFRLLNGTHQTGCQSPMRGATGVVQMVKNREHVEFILKDPENRSPFVAVVFVDVFRDITLINELAQSKNVNGLLVLHIDPKKVDKFPSNFSEDSTCPNLRTSLYSDPNSPYAYCKKGPVWNPLGTDLRMINWEIPVFYIQNTTEIELVTKCYERENKISHSMWPFCAAQLNTFFVAAQNSKTCMRRNDMFMGLHTGDMACDAMGDLNLFTFLPYTNKSKPLLPNSVVVLAARMDSLSLFYGLASGQFSSVLGTVIMLTLAEALGRLLPLDVLKTPTPSKRLLFVLFNGESFDYIGSSRMVWDISHDRFPESLNEQTLNQSALFNFSHIDAVIELDQLIGTELKESFYSFTDPQAYQKTPSVKSKVDQILKILYKSFNGTLAAPDPNTPLPPSSVQSFLRLNRSLPNIVLTGYSRDKFTNKYYNSFLDNQNYSGGSSVQNPKVLQKLAANLSQYLLNFLSEYVFPKESKAKDIRIDENVANRLTECFSEAPFWNCSIFRRINAIVSILNSKEQKKSLNPVPDEHQLPSISSSYVGVNSSIIRSYAEALLALFMGRRVDWSGKAPIDCSEAGYGLDGSAYKEDPKTRDGILSYTYGQDFMAENDGSVAFKPLCLISAVRHSAARSPAFEIPYYDLELAGVPVTHQTPAMNPSDLLSYSTWVETRWDRSWLKLFHKANPLWEWTVFVFGLIYFQVCLILGYCLYRTSGKLFAASTGDQIAAL